MANDLPSVVTSKRLVIRHWTATDEPALSKAIAENLAHLRPFMPWVADEPLTREERLALLERWRRQWESGGDSIYGIFLEGTPIGGTGLHRRLGPGVLEIGYWIHAAHTRRGYATEVTRALTDAAFAIPTTRKVAIHHDRTNVASRAVPQRLGFTLIAETPRKPTAPAEEGVECQWELTRDAWATADRRHGAPGRDRPHGG